MKSQESIVGSIFLAKMSAKDGFSNLATDLSVIAGVVER